MFKKIALIIAWHITGKKVLQRFYEALFQLSLLGMNVGGGASPTNSGEKLALTYIKNKLKHIKNPVIFDVGANVGDYTKLLTETFSESVKIYSFEPSHTTYKKLRANIGTTGNVNLYNLGFGNRNTKAILFSDREGSGLASVLKRKLEHYNISLDKKEHVELKTIDAFCGEQKISHIHLLKLDVEGNEMNVLMGARKILEDRAIPYIQFEFGGCNIDSRTYFRDFYYLLKDNYKIFRILKDGLFEVRNYSEKYEAFYTTNYLAKLKIKSVKGRIGTRS